MDAIKKLTESIKRNANGARQAQIRFAECMSTHRDSKTMDAKGTSDGTEYYGVMLGMGGLHIEPKVGSLCLIALIDGQETAAYLLSADEIDYAEWNSEVIIINQGKHDGLVMVKELTQKLNAIENDLNQIKNAFKSWVPVPEDGGAALKTASAGWAGQTLQETKQADIENKKVKH